MHVSGMYVSVHFMQPKPVIFMHKIPMTILKSLPFHRLKSYLRLRDWKRINFAIHSQYVDMGIGQKAQKKNPQNLEIFTKSGEKR